LKAKDTKPDEKETLYDVEKVEVEGPEFIEVKPKKIEEKPPVKKEEIPKKEETEEIKEEKLPEWQPVDIKKPEVAVKEKKEEEKPEPETEVFLSVEEKKEEFEAEEEFKLEEEVVVKERVKTKEEKKKTHVKEKREKKLEDLERKNKIDVFKEIESIDENTAVLLYDNGFMSIDDLKDISAKDLSRIKGIKKKLAKNIKKEISAKFVEAPIISNGEKPSVKKIEKDVFKNIKSIDQETSKLLYENGITSIEVLKDTPIKQLTKIKGIKRKLAKKIKKELKAISKKTDENGDYPSSEQVTGEWKIEDVDEKPSEKRLKKNPLIEEVEEEWDSFYDEDKAEQETEETKGYMHGDYTLYEKQVKIGKGKKRVVHFFSKAEPEDGEPIDLPPGFEVKVNKKTGVPYLKKKKK
jgi:ERCC4-type nuclease